MLFIASDHAGFQTKNKLKERFSSLQWVDLGCNSDSSVDYPDFADKLALEIKETAPKSRGVLICGSGQGMAMRANKYSHIRAALCWNEEVAILSREHNDANILCLGARLTPPDLCEKILQAFLDTKFIGNRHSQRVDKLNRRTSP